MEFNRSKTLQELENSDWGETKETDTSLIKECLELRRLPLKDFTDGDLCTMIGQEIGIKYLIPMALELLRLDPLNEAGLYPGCLLSNILRVSSKYWDQNPDLREEVKKIYQNAMKVKDDDFDEDSRASLEKKYLIFTEFGPLVSLLREHGMVSNCSCYAVEILAIIASRQPISLEAIIGFSDDCDEKSIKFLLRKFKEDNLIEECCSGTLVPVYNLRDHLNTY